MEARARVNASMLPGHQGRVVCLLGMAHDPSNEGNSFMLTTSDNKEVTINLQQPLDEYVQGLVEVQGKVDQTNNVECYNYVQFSPENSQNFDMEAYNKAVQLMNSLPEHYLTGVQQQNGA